MLHEIYTKLTITLETSAGMRLDEPNAVTTTISTELSDCSVHAWFQVFEQLLAMAGFQEQVIMQGGAQLAFNETREIEPRSMTCDCKKIYPNPAMTPELSAFLELAGALTCLALLALILLSLIVP